MEAEAEDILVVRGGNNSTYTVAGANFVDGSATNRTWVGSRGTEHASGYVTITKL